MTVKFSLETKRTNPVAIVTGVNGQDGSYLAEFLLEKGYSVIGIVRRTSTDNTERIKGIVSHKHFKLVEGDITDSSNVNSWISEFKPDEFYNLAAQSHVGTSFKQPKLTWRVNAEGVVNILEAIRNINPTTKFYQASTSEMFGKNYDQKNVYLEVEGERWNGKVKYQDESTVFSPQSPYAVAKVAAHQSVQLYRRAFGLHASCGILFNHESPRRGDQFVTRKITKWIGEFKKWAMGVGYLGSTTFNGNELILSPDGSKFPKLRLGNLDAQRDWGHAKDYVEAMYLMLQQEEPDDYVIATGSTYSVKDFLREAFSCIGIEDYKNYVVQDPEFMRPAEVDYLLGIADKAKEKLNWNQKIDFKSLVKEMVDSDVKNAR